MPERGASAVVFPVPEAEPVVAAWRARFDPSAAMGMPAHVTALYPFLDEPRLTPEVTRRLAAVCAGLPVLDVEFRCFGRFPGVLYLAPEPANGLRRLTLAIVEEWPEAPPYGGAFDTIVPHLTLADGREPDARLEAEVGRGLPIRARLPEAELLVFDGRRWQRRARLPFRP
jgi:2'-5' RNA ligase